MRTSSKARLLTVISLLAALPLSSVASPTDSRNIVTGFPIPKEGYGDQPYVVITRDGNWLCLLTTGPGTESQKFQHVVATISRDRGKTWANWWTSSPAAGRSWRMASWVVPLVDPQRPRLRLLPL